MKKGKEMETKKQWGQVKPSFQKSEGRIDVGDEGDSTKGNK